MTGSFKVEFVHSKSSSISWKKTVYSLPAIFNEVVNVELSSHSLYISAKVSSSRSSSSLTELSRLSLRPVKIM